MVRVRFLSVSLVANLRRGAWAAFFVIALASTNGNAQLGTDDEFRLAHKPPIPVPEGAKVTLEFDRQEYFIGENVLIHFIVKNVGKRPFVVDQGGDYSEHRQVRFCGG